MKTNVLILSIVMLSSVLGCIDQEAPGLEGTWNLNSYVNRADAMVNILSNTKVTFQFQDGKVGGNAGCNSYGGTCTLNGSSITIGPLAVTEMYCTDPGVMEQEADYLAALNSVTRYRIEGRTLVLINADGKDVLIFTKA